MGNKKRWGAFQFHIVRALFTVAFISSATSSMGQVEHSLTPLPASGVVEGLQVQESETRFESVQDLRQLQSQRHSHNYSFSDVYQREGLVQNASQVYVRDMNATRDLRLNVSLAVGHLGCKNFAETIVGLGANLRGGLGALGNSSQEARMLFYSEIRDALKSRFADHEGEQIRSRLEEAFILTLDSAASLDFSNPNSQAFVTHMADELQSNYQRFVDENGLGARHGCGLVVEDSALAKNLKVSEGSQLPRRASRDSASARPAAAHARAAVFEEAAPSPSPLSAPATKDEESESLANLETKVETKSEAATSAHESSVVAAEAPETAPTPTPAAKTQADKDKELIAKFSELGVPKAVLTEAFAGRAKHRSTGKITNEKQMVVMDLTRKTSEKRFWVLDLENGKISRSFFVAHGSGNKVGNGVSNPQTEVAYLSNDMGSNASTWGSMLMRGPDKNSGQPNATALEGLDSHNKNMGNGGDDMRKIKIHSSDYFLGKKNDSDTPPIKSGRSSGCPVLYPQDAIWVRSQIPAGTFMYAYKGDLPVISKGNTTAAKRAVASR